ADMARERGLEALAKRIFQQPRDGEPRREAQRYVDEARGVPDAASALAGARDIIAERLAMDSDLRAHVRVIVERNGRLRSTRDKKATDVDRFRDYLDYEDRVDRIPGHRYLAICRGESDGALTVKVRPDMKRTLEDVLRGCRYFPASPYGPEFAGAVEDALKRLLLPAAERAVRAAMKERADDEGIQVFGTNLEALLLAAPLGAHGVLGIDPGIRTGCKCAMVDAKGALIAHTTLYLVGRKEADQEGLLRLLKAHRPRAIAVGNGTGGREAEALVRDVVKEADLEETLVVSVNEAGASIYSASDIAREELPDVDLTVRGAVSIARRLQDPLAELVK
ncbi:MAG: Tex-like N-terminal domain-containing protein, partial [Myxococcota bacterium]|nr:Tex-like N-terminal domain-containing protein [Myxococcota bacterium]